MAITSQIIQLETYNFLSLLQAQLSDKEFQTQLSNQPPEGINISQLFRTIILYCENTGKK